MASLNKEKGEQPREGKILRSSDNLRTEKSKSGEKRSHVHSIFISGFCGKKEKAKKRRIDLCASAVHLAPVM